MRIHFIAIGGAAMHQLAIALHLNGHSISGSDDEIFEPALSNLLKYGLIQENDFFWNENKITKSIDLIILGMHARIDNPELLQAQKLGIKIVSFPEFVYLQSKNKKRIVIGGSHGKTTITSMIMHVLKQLGKNFDYLVGSRVNGFDVMVSLSEKNDIIIIEGDEYLSSCLDRRPKFHHYMPDIAVLSGIEWDHINVFPEFEQYVQAFESYINYVPNDGSIIYTADDENVEKLIANYSGKAELIPYKALEYEADGEDVNICFNSKQVKVNVFGEHNMKNLSAALEVCRKIGISDNDFFQSISSFHGAAKRLELIFNKDGLKIFRDFAHAPSKLKATVKAVKEQFEDSQVIAVFELHTFSSMSLNFLPQYSSALDEADVAIVYFSNHAFELKRIKPFTAEDIKNGFSKNDLIVINDKESLISVVKNNLKKASILLLMSSGNFDNIKIEDFFQSK